ncbi:MAG: calcium/sodium antiporter [Alphaproteobacteria bacterium]|jgi:cation:H+ antiporter|nr:calcium/sodium antiporter [Alphaproteobacteria bacterium]
MSFIQIFIGLALLFFGGESLVRGAVKLAQKFKLSKLITGITIVAYGTSSPELLITIQASLKGLSDIALGNVIGSNIANIFLVLGLVSILNPINVEKKLISFDLNYLLFASFILFAFIFTGEINYQKGLILLIALVIFTFSTYKRHKVNGESDPMLNQVDEIEEQFYFLNLTNKLAVILVVLGVFMLSFGANILVMGASELALQFGMSEAAIAVTIIAIGGSAPELATSVVAACRKHSDIAIGNVIGSNIFNILGVLGISSLISPIVTNSTLAIFDIWVLLFSSLLLFSFVSKKKLLSRLNGFTFLLFYSLYILWQFIF